MTLDRDFKERIHRRIEEAAVPAMAAVFRPGRVTFDEEFRPGLKPVEKAVSFHDYAACGVSVLAVLAARGDAEARALLDRVLDAADYYRSRIWNHEVPERGIWTVPLRRLLFHAALAARALDGAATRGLRERLAALVADQVPAAIEHCGSFLPGRRDLHLAGVNNHTAIFMQGVWHCGDVFGRPAWKELAREFGERYLASGHPDGYFEEHTNAEREGGPSMVYTPLTAGCLFDVLEGARRHRERFARAGDFFRAFTDHDYRMLPIADERANPEGRPLSYGLALHSLTARGRGFIVGMLEDHDLSGMSSEGLAVLYHEIDLMEEGDCETPENRSAGAWRIALPLGVLREGGFTACLSALRALNREIAPTSDYALDRQTVASLSHESRGPILLGVKSKNDPAFSTFRIGDDAYPTATGSLETGPGWAEATLRYRSFDASARWELGRRARLLLRAATDRSVTTALPVADPARIASAAPFRVQELVGFSPYTAHNAAPTVRAAVFTWKRELIVEVDP